MPYTDLFSLAVAEAPFGVVVCDASASIVFINPAGVEMFGGSGEALLGSPIDHIVPGAARVIGALALNPGRSAGPDLRCPSSGLRKDGTSFPVEIAASAAVQNGRTVVLASIVDVSSSHELEKVLGDHQAFDRAIADVATGFIATEGGSLDERIAGGQRRVAEVLGVDRSSLWQLDGGDFVYTHVWRRDAALPAPPPPPLLRASQCFPWVLEQVRSGRVVSFTRLDQLPSSTDRESYRQLGTKSGVAVPLMVNEELVGILSFASYHQERTWSPYWLMRLPLVAAVFANVLAREQATQALETAHTEVQRLKDQLALENVQLRREARGVKKSSRAHG